MSPRREGRGVSIIGDAGRKSGSLLPAGLTGVAIARLATVPGRDEAAEAGCLRLLGVAAAILMSSEVGKSIGVLGGLDMVAGRCGVQLRWLKTPTQPCLGAIIF
jgi:hypothetical protein